MEIIKREMKSDISEVKTKLHCQASFNSDGETKAIIKLFKEIRERISDKNNLPF